MRKQFFGEDASTEWSRRELESKIPSYTHRDIDIRHREAIESLFAEYSADIKLIVAYGRSTVARLGGKRPAHGLCRQCQRHVDPSGSDSQVCAAGQFHFHVNQ